MKKAARGDSGDTVTGAMRDQEVLRANRELAAYFKGRRTEREARAALKIIKGFIKERERTDAGRRRPLPGLAPGPTPKRAESRTRGKGADPSKRKPRRHVQTHTSTAAEEAQPDTSTLSEPQDSIERD